MMGECMYVVVHMINSCECSAYQHVALLKISSQRQVKAGEYLSHWKIQAKETIWHL